MLKIFGAPTRYLQGPGALDALGECAALFGDHAVLVVDAHVLTLLGDRLQRICAVHGVQLHICPVQGDITPTSVEYLCAQALRMRPPLVIAAGGGRALDAGKAVARTAHCHLLTVPTAASNDAPTSKNYVLYDTDHHLLAVEHMLFNPTMVIVDTNLVASAPADLFRAGLGDAISKKFEAEQCARHGGRNMFDGASTLTAQLIADGCFRTLLTDGEAALRVAGSGNPTAAFERAVEAMILMSGLGFESGGLSIAHALTRGLPHIPGVAAAAHGLQVAVGLLVQLHLEQRQDSMLQDLQAWYRRVGLPTTLSELGAEATDDAQLRHAAAVTMSVRHTTNFHAGLTAAALASALRHFAGNTTGLRQPVH